MAGRTGAYGKGQSKTERQIEAAQRAQKALRLRALRHSYDSIAKECGYATRGAAHQAVKRELAKIPREAAKELRQSELEGLDIAERSLARALARGDLRAIDRMLKIKDMRAKLTGLYEQQAETGVEEVAKVLGAFIGAAIKAEAAGELDDDDEIDDDELDAE